MKLGDIVTVTMGTKVGRPHVVVGGTRDGRVKLCYCGSDRWYVPAWHRSEVVVPIKDFGLHGRTVRRCKLLLLAERENPRPDGWIIIQAGTAYNKQEVIVGHVEVPWSWSTP